MATAHSPVMTALEKMVRYRGFKEVKLMDSRVLVGKEQTQEGHPRQKASVIVYYDENPTFGKNELTKALNYMLSLVRRASVDPSSSIVYVYSFPKTKLHTLQIVSTYTQLSNEELPSLEPIPLFTFAVDWSVPRCTRNWRIHSEEYYVLMHLPSTDPSKERVILVDKPPTIACESPEVRYIGGRSGDFVSFERLECLEVGPMWVETMRRVGKKVDIKEDGSKDEEEDDDEDEPLER